MNIQKRFYSFINDSVRLYNVNLFLNHLQNNDKIKILKNKDSLYRILNNDYNYFYDSKNSSVHSGKFGEKLVEELLILKDEKYTSQFRYKNLRPDFVTETHIIEVKTTLKNNKNYDNILFSSFKYYNIARLLKKSIKICLVGYDETHFNNFRTSNSLFDHHIKYQSQYNIEFVFFHNELLDYLKNDKDCRRS